MAFVLLPFEISGLEAFHRQGNTALGEGWTEIFPTPHSWKLNLGFPRSTFELGLSGCLGGSSGCFDLPWGFLFFLRDLVFFWKRKVPRWQSWGLDGLRSFSSGRVMAQFGGWDDLLKNLSWMVVDGVGPTF